MIYAHVYTYKESAILMGICLKFDMLFMELKYWINKDKKR